MADLFVALDTPDPAAAAAQARRLADVVDGLKLGLEFFVAQGPGGVRALADAGLPLFLDLKLHDIPNTVAGAVRSLAPLAPSILTVHAGGGRAMLTAARDAAPPETRVVAVTVLTSLDADDLSATGVTGGVAEQVSRLADVARAAGIDGLVCSGHEVAAVRAAWDDALLVVPGLRPAGTAAGDQKRAMTPRAAADAGASVLVIGRPITAADDPAAAARAIRDAL